VLVLVLEGSTASSASSFDWEPNINLNGAQVNITINISLLIVAGMMKGLHCFYTLLVLIQKLSLR
jgi:hypothetical protein